MPNEEHLQFPGDPALGDIYNRAKSKPTWDTLHFREARIGQAAELNDLQEIVGRKRTNIGNMVARDGDRLEGAEIVSLGAGIYQLGAGKVYITGDVRPVAAAQLVSVPQVGELRIGVRVNSSVITHEEDPDLLGLHEGTDAYNEDGAIREAQSLIWGYEGDGNSDPLYAVYFLKNGQVLDQTPPPNLSGVNLIVARYDYDAHENYIAEGCIVTPLGKVGDNQIISVQEGTANILGFKRTRYTSTRMEQEEDPALGTVDAEAHTFADGGSGSFTVKLRRPPLNGLTVALVEKQITQTVVRGAVANTSDLLSNDSVTEIVLVVQGATTYVPTTDYVQSGDSISWAPGGAEPAPGSSYDITYKYLDAVAPDSVTDFEVVLSGGVTNGLILLNYTYKIPRYDRVCFNQFGDIVYLKGVSAEEQPQPPHVPSSLLSLCIVQNNWHSKPTVINDGVRNYPFWQIDRMYRRIIDLIDLAALERLARNIDSREPVAKLAVFVDPFTSDRYRDAGEAQDAAVFQGTLQIAIDPTFIPLILPSLGMLSYTEEVIVRQDLVTDCQKVNPYVVFPIPQIILRVDPEQDFWTETLEAWLSPITQVFGNASRERITETIEEVGKSVEEATFLRQIDIDFTISRLGNGEVVDVLTFDDIDVHPGVGEVVGNAGGIATGTFQIPENVTSGVKTVSCKTAANKKARASFVGRGFIETVTRRRVTVIEHFTPQSPPWQGRPEPDHDGNPDPLAQTFMLEEGRHISSIDIKICAIGDVANPIIVELVTVDNGIPTTEVIATSRREMEDVIAGQWLNFPFDMPPYLPADREFAFVIKTADADHSVSTATRGKFDEENQIDVAAQPYMIGVLLSSSNARTWTPHQDSDLTMRIKACVFSPLEKVLDLGTFAVVDMSDLVVEANIVLPTDQTRALFRVTAGAEDPVYLQPGQNWERRSYFTGNLKIELVLNGTAKASPMVARNALAIPGSMRESGRYVTRAMKLGTDVRVDALFKALLPTGSTATVRVDGADDMWTAMPLIGTEVLANGDVEQRYQKDPYTNTEGRIEIVLTGTPAARPALSDMRAWAAV